MSVTAATPDSATRSRAVLLLAMLAPAVFTIVTDNIGEDFFIVWRRQAPAARP